MDRRIVSLDKQLGVRPVGIGDKLQRDITKLVLRVVGDQVKVTCGNMQLYAVLYAGIEGATNAVLCQKEDRKTRGSPWAPGQGGEDTRG